MFLDPKADLGSYVANILGPGESSLRHTILVQKWREIWGGGDPPFLAPKWHGVAGPPGPTPAPIPLVPSPCATLVPTL